MNSLKPFLFALVVIVSSGHSLYAQEAPRAMADSLRFEGELDQAVTAYRDVLRHHPDDGQALYALASTYALQPHRLDSAFHYLTRALAFDSTMRPLWDADLFFMQDDARWAEIEAAQLDKLALQVGEGFDRAYAGALLRIRMKEHAYRYHMMLSMRKLGRQSPVVTALANAMGDHHAGNMTHLEALIEDNGWPALSQVGEEAAYTAGNVINHADLETRRHYLPVLEAACKKGEGDWSRYAHILDRVELELGNKQVYGTQMEFNEQSRRFEPQPMIDPDNVHQRRAEIGLAPLEAQLNRFNESVLRNFGISK